MKENFFVVIRSLVGCKFEDNGRGPVYDCWGAVMEVYRRAFEIELIDLGRFEAFKDEEERPRLIEEYYQGWIPVETPAKADIVLMRGRTQGGLHAGVYCKEGRFFHVQRIEGGVISRIKSFEDRILGFYRNKELKCE